MLALELSRLARSSADWHQLLDLCALTGAPIADQDGVYSPGDFNDRLLLGLKGTMPEAELHLIRSRPDGGLRAKAARGELRLHLPVGLDRDEDGRIVLSPDEQVRAAIERVFGLWRRLCSARQVVAELLAEGQTLPRRRVGERRVRWAPGSYAAVHDFLTNPAYAGAFVFGRTREEKRLEGASSGAGRSRCRSRSGPSACPAIILATCPGRTTPRRAGGCARTRGPLARAEAPRERGRLSCRGCCAAGAADGRCRSPTRGRVPRYACVRGHHLHGTGSACQSVGGTRLDKAVARAFLEALTPAGINASARAVAELEQEHEARLQGQRLALERAEYEAGRARRQYDACEPEHRLVARTLAQALEEALAAVERERRELAALEQRRPAPLRPEERGALARLARDLPRLWAAKTTSDRDRKELCAA